MFRAVTKSAARRRRRTPDGAPEGATPSQEGVHIRTVAPPGAPSPPFFQREANIANLGREPRRENDAACAEQRTLRQ